MQVELRVRNRVFPLPGATARALASNAFEVTVPRSPEARRLLGDDLGKLDGAILVLDGEESEPALICAEGPDAVRVSAWILG